MYPCVRQQDNCSIGFWSYPVGRPTGESVKKWIQRCNFTLKVVARLENAESHESYGWLVKVKTQTGKSHLLSISADQASSHTKMRHQFMRGVNGAICRMKADDFLAFVDEDCCDDKILYMSRHIGKIKVKDKSPVWYFASLIIGETPVFFEETLIRSSGVALPALPRPLLMDSLEKTRLSVHKLGNAMAAVYGTERLTRVLHLCSSVMKAIQFDNLMGSYNFVPVTNISGPANCGKTLGCAIVLSMLECPSLMMSRCTPSAMIDAADTFKNLAIVWDDPRDCTHSQMSSIVHEAFNGVATSLITRGLRRYNSLLIVGTQDRNLGMPQTAMNTASFSRLSHIDMDIDAPPFAANNEGDLQRILKEKMGGMLSFFIEVTPFERQKIDRIYDEMLEQAPHIIGRSLQIAAIDKYYTSVMAKLMRMDMKLVDTYFETDYMKYLSHYCGKSDAVERFCSDLKQILLRRNDVPCACFKEKLTVDLKHYGPTECFAVYTKELLPYLQTHKGTLSYTKEQLHAAVKSTSKYGEVSKNVAYRVDQGTIVRRSLVIRQMFIM